jgi:hypothetical protein
MHNFNSTDILTFASVAVIWTEGSRNPLTWRRIKIFDCERVRVVYSGASAVRGSPETHALESRIGRGRAGKGQPKLATCRRVNQVVRFCRAIKLRRSQTWKAGVRVIQNTCKQTGKRCPGAGDVTRKINLRRDVHILLGHEIKASINPEQVLCTFRLEQCCRPRLLPPTK